MGSGRLRGTDLGRCARSICAALSETKPATWPVAVSQTTLVRDTLASWLRQA
jgi:hypothetical protein